MENSIAGNMPYRKIAENFKADWNVILHSTTLDRLFTEYDKMRKKNNIDKSTTYPKCFEIKSKAKNNWLIFMSKAHAVNSYKGLDSVSFSVAAHYQTDNGLEVITSPFEPGPFVYTTDFFNDYKTDMNIDKCPLDVVKLFFSNSGGIYGGKMENEENAYVSMCQEGIILGYMTNENILVNEGFISNSRIDSTSVRSQLSQSLQNRIEETLNDKDFDRQTFDFLADISTGLGHSLVPDASSHQKQFIQQF